MGNPQLDPETLRAARLFIRRLDGRYSIQSAILYGSRARGLHRSDSDADVAVVLDGDRSDRSVAAMDMAAVAFRVMLETGVLIEALPLWHEEIEKPETFSNPALIRNILFEGIFL